MIEPVNLNPENWKKPIYVASKTGLSYDDDGNEVVTYNTPTLYEFNYHAVSSNADIAEFGEKANITQKMVIPISYKGLFKEFDVAYLDEANPKGEANNGDNANYILLPPRNGNVVITIYMQKILGK